MGWCTTSDHDRFAAAAGGYLRSRAAENTMLLSAAATVGSGRHTQVVGQPSGPRSAGGSAGGDTDVLYGWWEPPDGSGPRGAFLHDPAVPLLIAGRTPEMAAALAGTLAKMGRPVCGVDAPVDAADAFAAAWSQRSRAAIRVHRHCRVYRLTAAAAAAGVSSARVNPFGVGPAGVGPVGVGPVGVGPAGAGPADVGQAGIDAAGGPGAWPPPHSPGSAGRLRLVTAADRGLLIDLLVAYGIEAGERIAAPPDVADDLISYGGAMLWEVPQRTSRLKEAAHYLVGPQHRDAAQQQAEPALQPVAMAAVARPVAGTVRINIVYTMPDRRRSGHAAAVTLEVSRAVLAGTVPASASEKASEVVLIANGTRSDRRAARLGYELVGERAVLRFGPSTGALPRLQSTTRPMPRLPTGPLPRLRR
jgi:hypothetical protein